MEPESAFTVAGLVRGYALEITARDVGSLARAAPLMTPGASVSITALPSDGLTARIEAAVAVRRLGFNPVPHVSARRTASAAELQDFLARVTGEAGVDQLFIVAGDPDHPTGPFADSLSLIRTGQLDAAGIRHVGIAGHPEGHPQIPDEILWQAMADKTAELHERGMSCEIVTQFSFDADPVVAWLNRLRSRGVACKVRIGVPGPASVATLMRFAARCGVGASTKVLAKYGISMARLVNAAGPDRLVDALVRQINPARHGPVGVQFYPFGGVVRTAEWAWEALVEPVVGQPGPETRGVRS